jgi:hypothetical protein
MRSFAVRLALILSLLGSGAVRAQEVWAGPVFVHTGYSDLDRAVGLEGRLGLPWLGLEVGAAWSRDGSARIGSPCAGLVPLGTGRCAPQELDITGTITTLSLGRPIPVVKKTFGLFAVPLFGVAFLDTRRRGTVSGAQLTANRTAVRIGLAAEFRGRFSGSGPLGYAARLYGGSLLSGIANCADCFQPFHNEAFEGRLSAGVWYRW